MSHGGSQHHRRESHSDSGLSNMNGRGEHTYGTMLRHHSRKNSVSSPTVAGRRYRMALPWAAADNESLLKQERNRNRYRWWAYYMPFLTWLPKYQLKWLRDDMLAALTVSSLYVPMCFSFAIIAQVDPISGLYAFIIHPLIYAFLGSCPQMIVGPEATGSLLVGSVVRQVQSAGENTFLNAHISGVTTAMAGLILLVAGISRIGFVDSMLNRPFMQGFISGVGFVLVIEQAIPELGLKELAREMGYSRRSAISKLYFLITQASHTHILTAIMAFSTLAFILIFRATQKSMRSKWPGIAMVPDRLVAILVTTILTWQLRLDERGVEILGALGTSGPKLPEFSIPFSKFDYIELVFTTSFLSALLGFFESSVTARSIRPEPEKNVFENSPLSPNRELIALGLANIAGGCFLTLPAFGGFGRSKLNVQAGGTTPMVSILLSAITLICVFFILPGLYYVPKAVLSAMASAVGISMMEECPHDLRFFFKVRGWQELTLMALVFLGTACYSMSLGIAIGILITLFTLVRHSAKSRIQILGRIPGTKHVFEDAELSPEMDQFDQCLIVRIAEPLTFANSGDLRTRLRRLEWYGTHDAHPSLPRVRAEDEILIFDVQGLTAIDACATQVLTEIVQEYTRNGAQVIFCRLRQTQVEDSFRRSGIVDIVGGYNYFVGSVEEALDLAGVAD